MNRRNFTDIKNHYYFSNWMYSTIKLYIIQVNDLYLLILGWPKWVTFFEYEMFCKIKSC